MKDLRRMMIEDENYDTDEDSIALGKAIEREIRENAKEEGYKEGYKEGREEGHQIARNYIISKLLSSGMSKEEISRRLDIPINKINT